MPNALALTVGGKAGGGQGPVALWSDDFTDWQMLWP